MPKTQTKTKTNFNQQIKNINLFILSIMKTSIETKTAGLIVINSEYLGNKEWHIEKGSKMPSNWNNHKVKVTHNKKSFSFEFWGSIMNPEISNDQENVFAFYCCLSDGLSAKDSFSGFCSEFGYDEDSRSAERIYKACKKSLKKIERVFDCDLYELIDEIADTYDC